MERLYSKPGMPARKLGGMELADCTGASLPVAGIRAGDGTDGSSGRYARIEATSAEIGFDFAVCKPAQDRVLHAVGGREARE